MKKIKSTVISVVHAHAPEKSDYVWTLRRPLVFGTSNAFSVGGNKRGRDGPFFFSLSFCVVDDRVPKDQAVPQRSVGFGMQAEASFASLRSGR